MPDELLKDAQLKCTPQRRQILQTLASAGKPLTAEELYERCPANGKLNLSTIYRTLNTLTRKGLLARAVRRDGTADYRLRGARHKHQLVCIGCGVQLPLEDCPLEAMTRRLEELTGFSITGHSLEFTGLCPNCRVKPSEPGA